MAIGSVSPGTGASAYTAAGVRTSKNDAAVAKLDRSADERAQLEYLGKHLHTLKDALATIREYWRRSDEPIPRGAAGVASLAVLTEPGDENRSLGELAAFAAVGAGTLTVNGTAVAFDPGTDSLTDLAARINAAGTGATASVDTATGRLLLTGDDPAADLVLDDGGSGLLEALGVTAGSHRPTSSGRTPGMAWSRAGTIAEAFGEAVAAINAIFAKDTPGGEPASFLVRTRGDLQKAVETAWSADTTHLAKDIGFGLDFETESGDVLSFTDRTEQRLVRALRGRASVSEVMLFGEDKEAKDGLIGELEKRMLAVDKRMETLFAGRGMTFDRYV